MSRLRTRCERVSAKGARWPRLSAVVSANNSASVVNVATWRSVAVDVSESIIQAAMLLSNRFHLSPPKASSDLENRARV